MVTNFCNPYVIGSPVVEKSFFGRDDLYQELELAYSDSQLPSYLLLGDRHIGKTSFLMNFNNKVKTVKLAYANLQLVGACPEGMLDIYWLITDAITNALGLPEISQKLDEESFKIHLKGFIQENNGLILAIDEYEYLQYLVQEKKIPVKFIKLLMEWASFPRFGLIMAGYHPLNKLGEEFHCLSSVMQVKKLTLLSDVDVKKILIEPTGNLLQYEPDALDLCLHLIHGHPYLANLMGLNLLKLLSERPINKIDVRCAWAKVRNMAKSHLLDFGFLLDREEL